MIFGAPNVQEKALCFAALGKNKYCSFLFFLGMMDSFSSLDPEQPVCQTEDCRGIVCVDICGRIIWAIFECKKLHHTFATFQLRRIFFRQIQFFETYLLLHDKQDTRSCISVVICSNCTLPSMRMKVSMMLPLP